MIIKKATIASFFVLLASAPAALAYDFNQNSGLSGIGTKLGYSPVDGKDKLPELIGFIINTVLSLVGVVLLVLLIYAGYLWMMDRGRGEDIKRAKDIIETAIIGLIIVVLAYAITNFVGSFLNNNIVN